ncbi:unnamed protein product [Didymodactylos carnosus]|uniref:Uncharacterized protein n=1 Tax=Didymodactylos carnosus TaxID=1234261 RepID=A0A813ZQB5_9BILA|nr:unnamed protein product [Didymodactylos carnosus]CAF0903694.1 unnamed protein product [Didymodactylos carnosus]CAF3674861.1 unnamed protein product [Didymodactylos carnosus]CAF3685815.1 unnamed protein product [Didymodactylos carnosus]
MRVKGVILITLALFLGLGGLILHLLAIFTTKWKITKRDKDPPLAPISYGLWQRCEMQNVTFSKQAVGINARETYVCMPNRYLRYNSEHNAECFYRRRECGLYSANSIPADCRCRYLPSTKGLQWLTILAAISLVLGLLLLYLKLIATAQNGSAAFLLGFAPFIFIFLAFLFILTTLILFGSYLRRDSYEEFQFPLNTLKNLDDSTNQNRLGFNLHGLKNYIRRHPELFDREKARATIDELLTTINDTYHTVIGWSAGFEIIALILVLGSTVLAFLLAMGSKSEDV